MWVFVFNKSYIVLNIKYVALISISGSVVIFVGGGGGGGGVKGGVIGGVIGCILAYLIFGNNNSKLTVFSSFDVIRSFISLIVVCI